MTCQKLRRPTTIKLFGLNQRNLYLGGYSLHCISTSIMKHLTNYNNLVIHLHNQLLLGLPGVRYLTVRYFGSLSCIGMKMTAIPDNACVNSSIFCVTECQCPVF